MFDTNPAWGHAAQALGLVLHEAGSFAVGRAFAQLKRTLGAAAAPPAKNHQWMVGRRNGTEVMVLQHVVSQGSSTTTYTHTLARVEPATLLGYSIGYRPWLVRKLGTSTTRTGDAWFDEHYELKTTDPRFMSALAALARSGQTQWFQRAQPADIAVSDAVVDLHSVGILTAPNEIARRLDVATQIAAALPPLLRPLHDTALHVDVARHWSAFAEAHRFAFDPERARFDGTVGALRVRIGLEGEPNKIFTTCVAEMPRVLGFGLGLEKQGSLQFLRELFGAQDIVVGDPVFDAAFVVKGANVAAVRQLFANRALTRALVELDLGSVEFTMNDAKLVVRWPRPITDEAGLLGITSRVHAVSQALFPSETSGPYR